ncbi:MAG: hypothetical protein Q9160_008208 [Pyrenula sp. 1 TL-2023]
MASLYQRGFASDAVITYVPTATAISGSSAIQKHFDSKEIRIRAQKVIGRIETTESLVLDVENHIEFLTSGGAYLPGLDNFITDKIVTFASIHIIHLNGAGNVYRARVHWDQASLLKQVGVIGSRSNSWPIIDSKEQTRLVSSSNNAVSRLTGAEIPTRGRPESPEPTMAHARKPSRSVSPSKRPLKDPHASLDLFEPIHSAVNTPVNETPSRDRAASVLSPQPSAKPPPRDLGDLFVSDAPRPFPPSPPKGAAGRFAPSRLWDTEADVDDQPKPKMGNPPKLSSRPKSTSANHWSFEDFNTPEKPKPKVRGQDQRHFGFDNDEEFEDATKPSRALQPRGQQVRHFGWGEDESFPGQEVESKGHPPYRKDQKTQFEFKDNSPTASTAAKNRPDKIRKDQESHFDIHSTSPATNGKENKPIRPPHRGGGYTVNRLFDFDD